MKACVFPPSMDGPRWSTTNRSLTLRVHATNVSEDGSLSRSPCEPRHRTALSHTRDSGLPPPRHPRTTSTKPHWL